MIINISLTQLYSGFALRPIRPTSIETTLIFYSHYFDIIHRSRLNIHFTLVSVVPSPLFTSEYSSRDIYVAMLFYR